MKVGRERGRRRLLKWCENVSFFRASDNFFGGKKIRKLQLRKEVLKNLRLTPSSTMKKHESVIFLSESITIYGK